MNQVQVEEESGGCLTDRGMTTSNRAATGFGGR
jgi:hypothetical protein